MEGGGKKQWKFFMKHARNGVSFGQAKEDDLYLVSVKYILSNDYLLLILLQVENHGVDNSLMEEVKKHVNLHYEEYMIKSFYNSDMVKELETHTGAMVDGDWESSFFIWHQPNSNLDGIPNLKQEFR